MNSKRVTAFVVSALVVALASASVPTILASADIVTTDPVVIMTTDLTPNDPSNDMTPEINDNFDSTDSIDVSPPDIESWDEVGVSTAAVSALSMDVLTGVVLSNVNVIGVTSGQISVTYTITNTTESTLSRSNTVAFYNGSAAKENYLVSCNLPSDVNPQTTVTMTSTVSATGIATVPLVMRLLDNGSTFPNVVPSTFPVGDTSQLTWSQSIDINKTVSLTSLSVSRESTNEVTLIYTIANMTDKAVSESSAITLYHDSPDTGNRIVSGVLHQGIPAGESVTITSTLTYSNVATQNLVLRLFDNGSQFPYLSPNAFYDPQSDNKTASEPLSSTGTVALSDFTIKKIAADRVTFTYTVTNSSNMPISSSSKLAFYKDDVRRSNFLFTGDLGVTVPQQSSATLSLTVTKDKIASMRIAAQLFDDGNIFPLFGLNRLIDSVQANKTVRAAPFTTKIACVGDSLTYGYGVESASNYPSQLQNKLGDDYLVMNYGVSSTTGNPNADQPYIKTAAFTQAISSDPDIVFIMLGSNDSKPINQAKTLAGGYKTGYKDLVQVFMNLPTHPKVYIMTPPEALSNKTFPISESMLVSTIRPQIREIGAELNVPVIELENLTNHDKSMYIADQVHLSKTGFDAMTNVLVQVLQTT